MGIETGLAVTGVIAALFGVGFAFLPKIVDSPRVERGYTMAGSLLVLACALALVVVPWMGDRA